MGEMIAKLKEEVEDLIDRNNRQIEMLNHLEYENEYLAQENSILRGLLQGIQNGEGVQTLLRIQAEDARAFDARIAWIEGQLYDHLGVLPPDEEPDLDRENPRE